MDGKEDQADVCVIELGGTVGKSYLQYHSYLAFRSFLTFFYVSLMNYDR